MIDFGVQKFKNSRIQRSLQKINPSKHLRATLCLLCGSLCNYQLVTRRNTENTQRTTEDKLK